MEEQYYKELHGFLASKDKEFAKKYPNPESFNERLQDREYSEQLRKFLASKDNSFAKKYPDSDSFYNRVKKKEEPFSPLEARTISEEPTQPSETPSENTKGEVIPKPVGAFDEPKASSGLSEEEQEKIVTSGTRANRVLEDVGELISDVTEFQRSKEEVPSLEEVAEIASEWGPTSFNQGATTTENIKSRNIFLERSLLNDDENAYTQKKLKELKPKLDTEYQNLTGQDSEEFVILQENGTYAIAPNALNEVEFESEKYKDFYKDVVEKREKEYEDSYWATRRAGELGAGVKNLYSVMGWFDPEGVNLNSTLNDAKLRGIKKASGMSDEAIDAGVVKNFANGNIEDGLTNLLSGVVSNLPQVGVAVGASMMGAPNVGAALLGATAGGQKYAELYNNPNIPTAMKMLIAAEVGAVELVTEKLGVGDIRLAQQALKNLGKQGRKEVALKVTKNFLKEVNIPIKAGKEELIEESIAAANEQLMDNIVEGKNEFDFYDVADAGLIAFGSGYGVGTANLISKMPSYVGSYKTANQRRVIIDKMNALREVEKDPNATEQEVSIAREAVEEAKKKLVTLGAEDDALYQNMTEEDVNEVIKLNRRIRRGLDVLDQTENKTVRQTLKDRVQDDFDKKKAIEQKYAEKEQATQETTEEAVQEEAPVEEAPVEEEITAEEEVVEENEEVSFAQDEIDALEKEVAKADRKKRDSEQKPTNPRPKQVKSPDQQKPIFALDLIGEKMVNEKGELGTIREENGGVIWESEDGTQIIDGGGSQNVDKVTIDDMKLSYPETEITDPVNLTQGEEAPVAEPRMNQQRREELEVMSEIEFEEAQKKADEDVKKFEDELANEVVRESEAENRLLFTLNGSRYAVSQKADGSFTVSKESNDGKFSAEKGQENRDAAINEFKKLKEGKDAERLKIAEELAAEYKKEQDDKIEALLDKLIALTSSKGRAFDASLGLPMFMLNSSLKIAKAAYKAGKSLTEAIQDGINHLKSKGYNVDEVEYKRYILKNGFTEQEEPKEKQSSSKPPKGKATPSSKPTPTKTTQKKATTSTAKKATPKKKGLIAKGLKTLIDINKKLWGLGDEQSKATAIIQDRIVGNMAKRAVVYKENGKEKWGIFEKKNSDGTVRVNVGTPNNPIYKDVKASNIGVSKQKMHSMIRFEKASEAPQGSLKQNAPLTWVSTAKEGLSKISQNKAEPNAWVKMISEKGGKGTSQELSWIGLQDFLDDYVKENNVKSVPKEVVEQYINDNQIEIVEVTKGYKKANEGDIKDVSFNSMYWYVTLENGAEIPIRDRGYTEPEAKTKALEEYNQDQSIARGKDQTKYSEYTLEGGENYREVLLTIPNKSKKQLTLPNKGKLVSEDLSEYSPLLDMDGYTEVEWFSDDYSIGKKEDGTYTAVTNPNRSFKYTDVNTYEDARSEIESEIKRNDSKEGDYKSSHWDESNILAHLRINERTLPNGERVMFIEEVQSDWAQKGKKEGFGTTPNMPYKKTDQWVGMAIRRALKMAADEGFDRVAWVTGEQSADRYDLSKQIYGVSYDYSDNLLTATDKNGNVVIRERVPEERLEDYIGKETAQKIVDKRAENKVISKEKVVIAAIDGGMTKAQAEKDFEFLWQNPTETDGRPTRDQWIRLDRATKTSGLDLDEVFYGKDDTPIELKNQDLKVGGEGMKTFYNSILPKVAEKEAKRFDKKAKVEVVDMLVGDNVGMTERLYIDSNQVKEYESKGYVRTGKTDKDFNTVEVKKLLGEKSKQLSIPITPEMRMNLNSAVPLFQGEKGAMAVEDGKYVIYALTDPNVSTPLHELAHVYEHYLSQAERNKILRWAGHSTWTTKTSEKFARGFEKYLSEGVSPTSTLNRVFEKFKIWLTDIYNGIENSDIDIELNEEMKSIYSLMIDTSDANYITQIAKDQTVLDAMPYLEDFDGVGYSKANLNFIRGVIENFIETGVLFGNGKVRAIIEAHVGIKNQAKKPPAPLEPKATSKEIGNVKSLLSTMFANPKKSIDVLVDMGYVGPRGFQQMMKDAAQLGNDWISTVRESIDKNLVNGKKSELAIQIVSYIEQKVNDIAENSSLEESTIVGIVLDNMRHSANVILEYSNGNTNDVKIANTLIEVLAKFDGVTTLSDAMSKLSSKEKNLLEDVYKANSFGLQDKIKISNENGVEFNPIDRYVNMAIRNKSTTKDSKKTEEELVNDPNYMGRIELFKEENKKEISEKKSGAQKNRKDVDYKLQEGEHYDLNFFQSQLRSFNNTNTAIFTLQSVVQMNNYMKAEDGSGSPYAMKVFGTNKGMAISNIETLTDVVNHEFNSQNATALATYKLATEYSVKTAIGTLSLNQLARLGRSYAIFRVMTSAAQIPKQSAVYQNVVFHLINLVGFSGAAGIMSRNIFLMGDYFSKGIENSPWSGLLNESVESLRDILETIGQGTESDTNIAKRVGWLRKGMTSLSDKTMYIFVKAMDKAAAQISFLNLYEAYMINNGLVDNSVFADRASHDAWWVEQGKNPNYKAIAFASTLVSKDQNNSAAWEKSKLQTDDTAVKKMVKSLLIPLINFKLSKVHSIQSDILIATSPKVSSEDRKDAAIRWAGTSAEVALFTFISLLPIRDWFLSLISDDDDETERFQEDDLGKKIRKKKVFWTRFITESLGITGIDKSIQNLAAEGFNYMSYLLLSADDEFNEKYPTYKIYIESDAAPAVVETYNQKWWEKAGYIGIAAGIGSDVSEMWEAALTGKSKDFYGNEIYYTESQKRNMRIYAIMASFGVLTPFGNAADLIFTAKKGASKVNRYAYKSYEAQVLANAIKDGGIIEISEDYIEDLKKEFTEEYGDLGIRRMSTKIRSGINEFSDRKRLQAVFAAAQNKEFADQGKISDFLVGVSKSRGSSRSKANRIHKRLGQIVGLEERKQFLREALFSSKELYDIKTSKEIITNLDDMLKDGELGVSLNNMKKRYNQDKL